jgi:hypothetical protein
MDLNFWWGLVAGMLIGSIAITVFKYFKNKKEIAYLRSQSEKWKAISKIHDEKYAGRYDLMFSDPEVSEIIRQEEELHGKISSIDANWHEENKSKGIAEMINNWILRDNCNSIAQ